MTHALPDAVASLRPADFEPAEMSPHRRRLHRHRNAPEIVGPLLDALALTPGDRVLHIGADTGYLTAVLAYLAADVIAIERRPGVASATRLRLARLGLDTVAVVAADGADGWAPRAPYDAIVVSARAARPPRHLLDQLAPGGRLVALVGLYRARQALIRLSRGPDGEVEARHVADVPLAAHLDEILVEMGALGSEQAHAARRAAVTGGAALADLLRESYGVSERDLVQAVALQRGFEVGELGRLLDALDPAVRARLSAPFARHNRVLPIALDGGQLSLATADPDADFEGAVKPFDEARAVHIHLLTSLDFTRLATAGQLGDAPVAAADAPREHDLLDDGGDHLGRSREMLRALLLQAVSEGASDLHFERYGQRVRIRLRVDGALYDARRAALSPADLVGVVNVIKVAAGLDIADRLHPQGGRFRTHAGAETLDLRVQTQPALDGEHVVIRLLSHRGAQRDLDGLGHSAGITARYRRLLHSPQGLVLVVGPTGSGKSTTLYAGLQRLAADGERKVITVEDPIEYSVEGIQQTAVRAAHGFTFADAMRVFVRQDPDVIFVGEIRDGETALEALRASQTGHLVLSTLHCNDAPDAVQRLIDLGMHPNSIAAELLAVLAQRLARRICRNCRVEAELDPELMAEVFPGGAPEGFRAWVGEGCPRCHERGVSGRIAVGELLRPTSGFKRAIARGAPLDELRAIAHADGMVPLRNAALRLVTDGVIPLSELRRMLPPDRLAPGTD